MIYLPDTNVFSCFLRGRPEHEPLRDRFAATLPACRLSAVALYELEYGAAKRPDIPQFGARVASLKTLFSEVEPFDALAAEHAARVRVFLAHLKPNAQPIGPYDLLLAGHALALGAVLVTHNLREFSRVPGLVTESWQAM